MHRASGRINSRRKYRVHGSTVRKRLRASLKASHIVPADDDPARDAGEGEGSGLRPRRSRVPPGRGDRHGWIDTFAFARRQVPATSPSTSNAPGQTRDVQSSARRLASGTSSSRPRPQSRKNVSPLGRRRAGAGAPAAARNVDSSLDRIQPSPMGVRTGVSSPARRVKRPRPRPCAIPAHCGEGLGRGRSEDVEIPTSELHRASRGIDVGRRDHPERRLSSAIPPDEQPARRRRRSAAGWDAWRAAEPASSLPVRLAGEERLQQRRRCRRPAAARPRLIEAPEREDRQILLRDDVHAEPGPQSWTSDGSSQVDGSVPSTRAWIESSAARGMLSVRPAHAACAATPRRAEAARRARRLAAGRRGSVRVKG